MYQHTGETAQYHASLIIKPEEHIGVIQLANFGGDMTPIGIGIGVADIMTGKEPKVSNFISLVYMVERVIVILILIFLLTSIIKLKNWNKRIKKSKAKYVLNLIFTVIINFALPIYLLLFFPKLFDSEWASSMLIFPDVTWTILLTSVILLFIGMVKGVLSFFTLTSKVVNVKG
jgi:hypothetical protein